MDYLGEATSTIAAGLSWGLALPADVAILTLLGMGGTALFIVLGLDRAVSFVMALVVGAFLYRVFPYFDLLGEGARALWVNLALYAALVALLTLLLSRVVSLDYSYVRLYRFLQAAALAVSAVGILLSFSYNLISTSGLYSFGPLITALFAPEEYLFWWLPAPFITLWSFTRR